MQPIIDAPVEAEYLTSQPQLPGDVIHVNLYLYKNGTHLYQSVF